MTTFPVNDRYEDRPDISLMAHDQYVREVAWMQALEPLGPEEEGRLLGRVLRAKREPNNAHVHMLAKYARERLVEGYQPHVMALARQVARNFRGMEWLDLVNEGNLGVLRAIDQYSESVGCFGAAVTVCVRHAFWEARYGTEQWSSVSGEVRQVLSRIRRLSMRRSKSHEGKLSVGELAAALQVRETLVEEALALAAFERMESLQGLVNEESSEDRYSFVSLYAQAVADEDGRQARLHEVLEQAVERSLPARQQEVIRYRYGFDAEGGVCRSVKEVAELLHLPAQSVGQVERRGRRRLRNVLELVQQGSQVACELRSEDQEGFEAVWVQRGCYREDYYSLREVARVLEVGTTTVRNYVGRGLLPFVRWGRLGPGKVGAYLFPKQAVHELAARRRGERMSA